jgi:hypothetical protein
MRNFHRVPTNIYMNVSVKKKKLKIVAYCHKKFNKSDSLLSPIPYPSLPESISSLFRAPY